MRPGRYERALQDPNTVEFSANYFNRMDTNTDLIAPMHTALRSNHPHPLPPSTSRHPAPRSKHPQVIFSPSPSHLLNLIDHPHTLTLTLVLKKTTLSP